MTELLPNIFAIEVPVKSYRHEYIHVYYGEEILRWYINPEPPPMNEDDDILDLIDKPINDKWDAVNLPPGNYSFICASLTATEEEAAKIVEPGLGSGYADYEIDPELKYCDSFIKATDALLSILRSKGLNPELNYAILQKQF